MPSKFAGSCKRFCAMGTSVRLFTGVNKGVRFEGDCGGKILSTMFTLVRSFT